MKIALMGGWNMDSGAAFHTEMVGRSWVKAGHDVKVFSFVKENFHGTNIIGADEPYVTRCFTTWSATPQKLDPHPFLACDYDIFVAEDHGMGPRCRSCAFARFRRVIRISLSFVKGEGKARGNFAGSREGRWGEGYCSTNRSSQWAVSPAVMLSPGRTA